MVAILSAEDLGDPSPIPVNPIEGAEIVPIAPPLLAGERARFAGEAVAAVLAESRAIAEDAVELVELDLEPLPVVVRTRMRSAQTWSCTTMLRTTCWFDGGARRRVFRHRSDPRSG